MARNEDWRRADIPPGIRLRFPGVALQFGPEGYLQSFAPGGEDLPRMRLARVESDRELGQWRLVFEADPTAPLIVADEPTLAEVLKACDPT